MAILLNTSADFGQSCCHPHVTEPQIVLLDLHRTSEVVDGVARPSRLIKRKTRKAGDEGGEGAASKRGLFLATYYTLRNGGFCDRDSMNKDEASAT